jgi:four helix bundle protein
LEEGAGVRTGTRISGGESNAGAEHRTSNIEHRTSKEEKAGAPPYDLEERLLEYATRIIRLVDSLKNSRAANHVGGQLLRSGTSPLPNHGEAQAAESLNDFIHKLKICLKELRESHRWLRLIKRVPLIENPAKVDSLTDETDQLIRIFVSSLRKASSRQESSSRVAEEGPESDSEPSMFDVQCSMFDVQPPAGPKRKPVTYALKKRVQSRRKSP